MLAVLRHERLRRPAMKTKLTSVARGLSVAWGLAGPYFRSNDRVEVKLGRLGTLALSEKWIGRGLVLAVVCIEIGSVGVLVLLNLWNASFFDAIQDRNVAGFWKQLAIFVLLSAAFVVTAVYQLYLNQWLHIRWRTWMTHRYLRRWLDHGTHYRMRLGGEPADNPDQRIAEDVEKFVHFSLSLALGLLSAAMTLASFVVILWSLSAHVTFPVGTVSLAVPGSLVWIALAFAMFGTYVTHAIGRPLVDLNFTRQRSEADFRFALVRLRENSEPIALARGEAVEQRLFARRFASIVSNWHQTMGRTKKLTFFTAGYNHVAVVLPTIAVAPQYFAGAMSLGTLTQTGAAFAKVQTALSFVVTAYQRLAEWQSVVDRLVGFEVQVALAMAPGAARPAPASPALSSHGPDGETVLTVEGLAVRLPDGRPLVDAVSFTARRNEALLLMGPSGCGKSTLLRAIGGLWPFAEGRVDLAPGSQLLALSQSVYLPLGTLAAVLAFPANEDTIDHNDMRHVLVKVGLPELVDRLHETASWSDMLSLGERQRLAIGRALIRRPDVLLMDEATSSLDESGEADLYRMLRTELSGTAIVSIGHRSTLLKLHDARIRCDWLLGGTVIDNHDIGSDFGRHPALVGM